MHVHAKLGCLLHSQVVSGNLFSDRITVRQEYATTMMKFDRPEEGATKVDVVCPVCGHPVALSVASANRVEMIVLASILVGITIIALFGWALFELSVPNSGAPDIGLWMLVASAVALAVLITLVLVKPEVLDYQKGALSISNDPVVMQSGSHISESRGHKLLDIWVKQGERAGQKGSAAGANDQAALPGPASR